MINLRRRGFTIVELVIVVAVIAILAAILIPTFSNLVEKANMSSDQRAVRDMNTLLALDEANNGEVEYEHALEILTKGGYKAENYRPLTDKAAFYWIKSLNRVVLAIEESKDVLFPKNLNNIPSYATNEWYPLIKEIIKDPYLLESKDAPIASTPNCEIAIDLNNTVLTQAALSTGDFYTFRPTDDLTSTDEEFIKQREKYGNWIADFAIILNDDFKDQSAGIAGSFFGIPWKHILMPGDHTKGTVFYLMDAFPGYKITYKDLLEACKLEDGKREGFHCGAFNLDKTLEGVNNAGKSVTVQLRLYQPNEQGERQYYVICSEIECTFKN